MHRFKLYNLMGLRSEDYIDLVRDVNVHLLQQCEKTEVKEGKLESYARAILRHKRADDLKRSPPVVPLEGGRPDDEGGARLGPIERASITKDTSDRAVRKRLDLSSQVVLLSLKLEKDLSQPERTLLKGCRLTLEERVILTRLWESGEDVLDEVEDGPNKGHPKLDQQALADLLQMNPGTIRKTIHRLRKKLLRLEKRHEEEG